MHKFALSISSPDRALLCVHTSVRARVRLKAGMGTFGDSTPVLWSTGLSWDGNDDHPFEEEGDGWQEVGLATDVAEHFQGHVSQSAPEPLILGEGRECKISVAELLLVAAHTDQPELNFPVLS